MCAFGGSFYLSFGLFFSYCFLHFFYCGARLSRADCLYDWLFFLDECCMCSTFVDVLSFVLKLVLLLDLLGRPWGVY